MERAEIINEINRLEAEIRNLQGKKTEYESLNRKLSETLNYLKNAITFTGRSREELRINFISETATQKRNSMQYAVNEINKMAKCIEQEMIVNCKEKLRIIQATISENTNRVQQLRSQLSIM